jgi:hypothetical protein
MSDIKMRNFSYGIFFVAKTTEHVIAPVTKPGEAGLHSCYTV